MSRLPLAFVLLCLSILSSSVGQTSEPGTPPSDPQAALVGVGPVIEELAERCRRSVVVITVAARDGSQHGVGTGFVISADGLIATNYHVIGEARPISVQTVDGTRHDVTEIVAFDRQADLAVVRIDANDLTPLELGDSDELKPGRPIVALGNPMGLKHSVAAGIVAALREFDGRQRIQLALPIERGNSGGPVLELDGQVQGILNMKSAVTANLGFAVPINDLKPLLERPKPIPMARWLAIGQLDEDRWEPRFGGNWRRRAGRIVADEQGNGFGGRTLCLWRDEPEGVPYELAVTVKLDDESGAAGLVFASDGDQKHYGFYPSAGRLRLTRFDGPDVYSWTILMEQPSPHYRPGDWNTLKIRRENDRTLCYVNDHLVFETADRGLAEGRVGLAKFRNTVAEFKNFRLARELPSRLGSQADRDRLAEVVDGLNSEADDQAALDTLLADAPTSVAVLRERAYRLAQRAERLRQLADEVHRRDVLAELARLAEVEDDEIDLVSGALWIAALDNDDVDVAAYREEIESMADDIRATLEDDADEAARLAALNRYLFEENGFHGSRSEYYHRANSYLDRVIDDREGLPITLSLIYMELGRRLGLNIVGIGLPGHFVVEHRPAAGEPQLIDVFDAAAFLSREEAEARLRQTLGTAPDPRFFEPSTRRAILVRMLRNLLGIAQREGDLPGMQHYLDAVLALAPEEAEPRWMRAVVRFQLGDRPGALEDVDWLLVHEPEGIDLDRVHHLRNVLEAQR